MFIFLGVLFVFFIDYFVLGRFLFVWHLLFQAGLPLGKKISGADGLD